jgi:hypothetical protein
MLASDPRVMILRDDIGSTAALPKVRLAQLYTTLGKARRQQTAD